MAKNSRDNFSARVVRKLGERVNYLCSNPDCNARTIGPHQNQDKSTLLGVAAHICAAAPGGPRYDTQMSKDERESSNNGIWLCENCSTLIDKDQKRFPATLLHEWKRQAEEKAQAQLGKPQPDPQYKKLKSDFKPRDWQAKSVARFHFSARATDLIGRESEFAALNEFCQGQPEQPFSWHLLLGKGGMGKSRLAYELGLHLAQQNPAWDWQFLGSDTTLKQNLALLASGEWRAQRPTLLIVDYAATVAEELRAAILACAAKPEGPCLRLLLIERNLQGDWYQKLLGTASGGALLHMQESRYQAQALELRGLSIETGLAILQALLTRYQSKPACDLRELLDKLDAEHRPLFILFLADALREGGAEVKWQAEDLTQAVLDRELKRWEEQGVLEVDKHLICFATLCGEIDLTADLPEYLETLLQEAERHTKPNLAARIALATNAALDGDRIPKLEPDLLGELFVLQCLPLAQTAREQKQEKDRALFVAAWQAGRQDVFSFFARAVLDFAQHPDLLRLAARLECYWVEDDQVESMAAIYAILCFGFAERADLTFTREYDQKLESLSASHLKNENVARMRALAAVNVVSAYGNAGELEAGRALLEQIATLIARWPENQELALEQAKAAFNLITAYGKAGEREAGSALLGQIAALVVRWPENQELALSQAKAAFNLMNAYCKAGEHEAGSVLLGQIVELGARRTENRELASIQAKATFNLITEYAKTSGFEAGIEPLGQIVALGTRWPEDQESALLHADAVLNLMNACGKTEELEAGRALLEQIAVLGLRWPENQELALRQVQAMVNLMNAYREAGELDAGRELQERIVALSADRPVNQELVLIQAQAAFNLFLSYVNVGNAEQATCMFNQISNLCLQYPEHPGFIQIQEKCRYHVLGRVDIYFNQITDAAMHINEENRVSSLS